jgi:hypothetical protein
MTKTTFEIHRAAFKFHDTTDRIGVANFAIGCVPEDLINDPGFDDDIFYYCATEEEYANLFNESNSEDFYLIKEDK